VAAVKQQQDRAINLFGLNSVCIPAWATKVTMPKDKAEEASSLLMELELELASRA
jgi:hypothetical protein